MSWLISDAIAVVRDQTQDTRSAAYRNSDVKLMRYFNTAISDMRRIRPDIFLPDLTAAVPLYTDADLADAFPIDSMYFVALTDYIVGMIDMESDEFASDGRAMALLNRFTMKLIGQGA